MIIEECGNEEIVKNNGTFSESLSCPCWNESLNGRCLGKEQPQNCTRGLVWDVCFCCKDLKESCGGMDQIYGRCGKDLMCQLNLLNLQNPGKCIIMIDKKIGESCGEDYQQGNCQKGLTCVKQKVWDMGRCVDLNKNSDFL
ncbi:unnamed protein product [Gordionus sp. m RMFG-2023]